MILQHLIDTTLSLDLDTQSGIDSHLKMAPYQRATAKEIITSGKEVRKAATLLLCYEKNNEVHFILTKRTDYEGTHGGQISFPGGKLEQNENAFEAALRETNEEIGVESTEIKIIQELTQLYIPPSNMLVTPFIGYIKSAPTFFPDSKEVERIIEIKISDLLNDDLVKVKKVKVGKLSKTPLRIEVPYFDFDNETVWGATAMILSEVKEILKKNL